MLVLLRKFLSSLRILHNPQGLLVSAVCRERGRCVVRVLEVGTHAIARWRINRVFSREFVTVKDWRLRWFLLEVSTERSWKSRVHEMTGVGGASPALVLQIFLLSLPSFASQPCFIDFPLPPAVVEQCISRFWVSLRGLCASQPFLPRQKKWHSV